MEYSLDFITFWKYHLLVLYYWLGEYPPVVRFCAIFILICFLLMALTLLWDLISAERDAALKRRTDKYRKRFYDGIRAIAVSERPYSVEDVNAALGLSPRIRMRPKKWKCYIPMFRELFIDVKASMKLNINNWRNVLIAFKMPNYFEAQVRSPKIKERLDALKDVSDISCDLKEATASRYLYAKDEALRITSRLHTARYGMSYPFQVFGEDAKSQFTDEMCTKLHWVIRTRYELGLSIPNFIRWAGMASASTSFRIFSVNEIRLFRQIGDCPELLNILRTCKDEKLSCAIIKTLGELQYKPAEDDFFHRYMYANVDERLELARALGAINSGRHEVVDFLVDDFCKSTNAVTKVGLLSVLYAYGEQGREAYNKLKAVVPEYDLMYFDHVESDLIDNSRYA